MLSKKSIVLKNGQNVSLEFFEMPECFSIYAVDQKNEVVGLLSFEIMRKYVCKHSDEYLKEISATLGAPISTLKKEEVVNIMQSYQNEYDIHGDFFISDGQRFNLKQSVVFLNLIEIKNKDFFQVGLGSAMHKEMEDFALANGCDEIRLSLYYPFGEFRNGTHAFYEHAGYVFDRSDEIVRVYKPLPKNLNRSSQSQTKGTALMPLRDMTSEVVTPHFGSSIGTPIKEKYLKEK